MRAVSSSGCGREPCANVRRERAKIATGFSRHRVGIRGHLLASRSEQSLHLSDTVTQFVGDPADVTLDFALLPANAAIQPDAPMESQAQLKGSGSPKYVKGQCVYEENAHTFVMQTQAAGLAKKVKAALLEQTQARYKVRVRGQDPDDIDEDILRRSLFTADMPDPDLVIRTSGEKRISNFLLWQSAYAEYVFTDTLWPDFSGDHLKSAIVEFGGRKRRYGATA